MEEQRAPARRRAVGAVLLAAGLGVVASGCASTTAIGELTDDPQRYDGQTVRIEGDVTSAVGFLGPGFYQVRDDTGEVPVVSEEGGAPTSGAHVVVEGTFHSAFTVGAESLSVLVEEKRTSP